MKKILVISLMLISLVVLPKTILANTQNKASLPINQRHERVCRYDCDETCPYYNKETPTQPNKEQQEQAIQKNEQKNEYKAEQKQEIRPARRHDATHHQRHEQRREQKRQHHVKHQHGR